MTETWKSILSEPDLEASSLGRIRVIPYEAEMPRGGKRTYGGVPTFGQWDGERFIYCRRGHKTLKVAKLVCEAFHGPRPFPKAVVMHDDEHSANNRQENLKWGTQKENLNYPGFLAYCAERTGANNPYRKGKREQEACRTQYISKESR